MDEPAPRIPYPDLDSLDEAMREELVRCAREGTPRPESSAVRAHSPAAFWSFARSWQALFREGVVEHELKELCRLYVSRSLNCAYCGNQRSEQARQAGFEEAHLDALMNFESSPDYDERQRAALRYAEAITWRLDPDDAFWEQLHAHFSDPELVELAGFICLTMGQQSWIRLLRLGHHQVLDEGSAGLRPGA
jgi:alkylhydroperoxidase family enzyme